jgi:DNA/RNA-binding domain of Phe-tRNA-synthetase-like protein
MIVNVSQKWFSAFPEAAIGILVIRDVANPEHQVDLDKRKFELETRLRESFYQLDRSALAEDPVIQAYSAYYKRFNKTYHILLQLDSIIFKGKPIPNAAALVEAMFIAEMEDRLLTAGHDLEKVQAPLLIDVADGTEKYTLLREQEQTLKPGDMFISDTIGVLSSIIYGPDFRTRITPDTRQALFTTYAPPGIPISALDHHLENIKNNILLYKPDASLGSIQILSKAKYQ